MIGPYDVDPPWGEGPSSEPERCAACGTERYESDVKACGGCGFTWDEIAAAVKAVDEICKALGVDVAAVSVERHRAAVDAALSIFVPEDAPR